MIFETVRVFLTTLIWTGSFWYFLVSSRIALGIVAENKAVCLSSGTFDRIVSISSLNPMSNISSASSKTTIFTWSSFNVFLFIWSITRPGVPITTCTPPFRAFICLSIGCPPYIGRVRIPCIYLASFLTSSETCIANSLVGHNTIACNFLLSLSIFSRIGILKDAVLPVPVWACPITS